MKFQVMQPIRVDFKNLPDCVIYMDSTLGSMHVQWICLYQSLPVEILQIETMSSILQKTPSFVQISSSL